MDSDQVVIQLQKLKSNIDETYDEIKQIAKQLVGKSIVFKRGTKHTIHADVLKSCDYKLNIEIVNVQTGSTYEVSMEKINIIKIT